MWRLLGRLAVLLCMLLVPAGHLAACAGWQGPAEARMACCTGPGGCPMHAHGADDQTGSTPSVSQADADSCCASSENGDATQTSQARVVGPPALVAPFVLADPESDVRHEPVRAHTSRPPPGRAVPRHLLLAVFLL